MSDTTAASTYDLELDLSPEVLTSLLRRRAQRDQREHGSDDDAPRASQEHLYAAWL